MFDQSAQEFCFRAAILVCKELFFLSVVLNIVFLSVGRSYNGEEKRRGLLADCCYVRLCLNVHGLSADGNCSLTFVV